MCRICTETGDIGITSWRIAGACMGGRVFVAVVLLHDVEHPDAWDAYEGGCRGRR
jgi:hypothetical protein